MLSAGSCPKNYLVVCGGIVSKVGLRRSPRLADRGSAPVPYPAAFSPFRICLTQIPGPAVALRSDGL